MAKSTPPPKFPTEELTMRLDFLTYSLFAQLGDSCLLGDFLSTLTKIHRFSTASGPL